MTLLKRQNIRFKLKIFMTLTAFFLVFRKQGAVACFLLCSLSLSNGMFDKDFNVINANNRDKKILVDTITSIKI